MSSAGSFRAIVSLGNMPGEVEHLKRLALMFDEIYYLHPQIYCLEDMSLVDPSGKFQVDFFRDCVPYDVITLENLKETIDILEDAKIAKGIVARDETLTDLRRDIALIDHADPEFRKLTPDSTPAVSRFGFAHMNGPERGKRGELVGIIPSLTIWDSLVLTNTLYLANKEGLYPVFLEPRHRKEMKYRYDQYRQRLSSIASAYPDLISPVNFPTQFGEVTFSVFKGVWSHELLVLRSLQEIVKYRHNMAPARKKYIASLTELADIAENNPWNQKTKDTVSKYLLKLEADLVSYRQEAERISKKMFGNLIGRAIEAGFTGLSGVLGQGISNWALVLAAVLMASRTVPQVVKAVLDYRRDRQDHRNSSIAYIAEFVIVRREE